MADEETYDIPAYCNNCRKGFPTGFPVPIPKGQTIASVLPTIACPYCGVASQLCQVFLDEN